MLKSRGQMGQLVTVTRAGSGSGLPALRGCGSAMKPIFSGERKAARAQRRASARRGRGRCEQPSSTPRTGRGLRVANKALNPSQNAAEPQDEELGGGCTSLPAPGRTGAGPHRGAGGSFATGSGCGSAPSRLHPWQGGTEAPAFPSLASLVVLIREAGAGRAALPTSRGNERCCRSRLMGNRFPGAGGPRGWWCCARLCPRSSPPCGEDGTHPMRPVSPVPKALLNWERFHAVPKDQVLTHWRGEQRRALRGA